MHARTDGGGNTRTRTQHHAFRADIHHIFGLFIVTGQTNDIVGELSINICSRDYTEAEKCALLESCFLLFGGFRFGSGTFLADRES